MKRKSKEPEMTPEEYQDYWDRLNLKALTEAYMLTDSYSRVCPEDRKEKALKDMEEVKQKIKLIIERRIRRDL